MNENPPPDESTSLPAWRVFAATALPFVALAAVLLTLAYVWLDPRIQLG